MTNDLTSGNKISYLLILFYVSVVGVIVGLTLRVGVRQNKQVATKTATATNNMIEVNAPTQEEKATMGRIRDQVVPKEGFKFDIKWGSVGKGLVASGAIDMAKYASNYPKEKYANELVYLTEEKNDGITINSDNAYFWVNTLWALGLNQQSQVLTEMKQNYTRDIGNLASTGGWTLGAKPAMELYNKEALIPLTDAQQELVNKISANIYRPCCNNSTAFPDCNHGMAALALVELMVSQNFSEQEIYRAVLAFNSYWFSQTYVDLAYYFQKKENTTWADVNPKLILSSIYSSSAGYSAIKRQIGNVPGVGASGPGCGA